MIFGSILSFLAKDVVDSSASWGMLMGKAPSSLAKLFELRVDILKASVLARCQTEVKLHRTNTIRQIRVHPIICVRSEWCNQSPELDICQKPVSAESQSSCFLPGIELGFCYNTLCSYERIELPKQLAICIRDEFAFIEAIDLYDSREIDS